MTPSETVSQTRFVSLSIRVIQALFLLSCLTRPASAQNDFSITASPNSQTVWQGQNTSYLLTVTVDSSFSGQIGLTASGMPSGMTATLNPTSISGSATVTLLVSASPGLAVGSYSIAVSATSGSEAASATVTVNVAAPPPIQYTYL